MLQTPTNKAHQCRTTTCFCLPATLAKSIVFYAPVLSSMSSEDPPPTERSPLLSSRSSATLANDSQLLNHAPPSISRGRGSLIIASLGTLVFILSQCVKLNKRFATDSDAASNISMLTTVQSPIAIELDGFNSVSWFASTYLVCIIQD